MAFDPFNAQIAAAAAASAASAAAKVVGQAGGLPNTNAAVLLLCDAVISLCGVVQSLSTDLSAATQVSQGEAARAMITTI